MLLIACSMCICPYECPYSRASGSYRASFFIFPKFLGLTKDHPSCICTGHNLPKFTELMTFVNFATLSISKRQKKKGRGDFADSEATVIFEDRPMRRRKRSTIGCGQPGGNTKIISMSI